MAKLSRYQSDFISFLIEAQALKFGEFKLKSGRLAPYFVNTGLFNTGVLVSKLGRFYAAHIHAVISPLPDVLFGPAYKGIPLSVATSIALQNDFDVNVGFTFDRKVEKDHGDGGLMVGAALDKAARIVIVEDVITAGTTLNKVVPLLRSISSAEISGVVVAVDRCEKGEGTVTAVQEVSEKLGITVYPIVTIYDILEELSCIATSARLTNEQRGAIERYLSEYGGQQ